MNMATQILLITLLTLWTRQGERACMETTGSGSVIELEMLGSYPPPSRDQKHRLQTTLMPDFMQL